MYQKACHYATIGQRDKACQTFRECLSHKEHQEAAQTALAALEQQCSPIDVRRIRLPVVDYVYVIFAKTQITIGRQEDNDIAILNTDVSRYHARLRIQDGDDTQDMEKKTCMLEDLGSSNGTRLNGLRIQQKATVRTHDTIGLGLHTQFEICLQERPAGLSVLLTPRNDQRGLAQRYVLFSDAMFIGTDCDCELPLLASLIPTPLSYLFKIAYRPPYWYVYIHPHAQHVLFNGISVDDYVIVTEGDTLAVEGFPFVFT
jgi:pSer/pThr/pTyr-binding forkhead associated (FHA) protein